jgi:RNA polymerase sigma-70 factor (ECF subfamily)
VVANTVLRGEEPRNRLARWSRWFATTPSVDAARFQGDGEPYPRHWRRFPEPWPGIDPGDPEVRAALIEAIGQLPVAWREVLIDRDVLGRDEREIDELRGVTPAQQRAMLNRSRALVRERLAERFAPGSER